MVFKGQVGEWEKLSDSQGRGGLVQSTEFGIFPKLKKFLYICYKHKKELFSYLWGNSLNNEI